MKPRSLRSAAKEIGVALSSLQARIKAGSVTVTADGKIADVAVARAQWLANTAVQGPAPLADRVEPPPQAELGETYQEARRRNQVAIANLKEIEIARRAGKLCLLSELEAALSQEIGRCRSQLLAIPSRVREASPHLAMADVEVIETVIRQALEDLANGVATVPETSRKAAQS